MNSRRNVVLTASLLLVGCAGGGQDLYKMDKVSKGNTIVTVNGTQIHEGLLDVLSELNPRIKAQLANPVTKQKILGSLVDQEILYQEAVRRGLDKKDDVALKTELNRHVIISNALLEDEMNNAMQKQYEEEKDAQFTKVSVSQIFISAVPLKDGKIDPKGPDATPEQKADALTRAKAVKERLDKGEEFAKVASEVSDDAATKSKGGKAGLVSKNDKRYARLGITPVAEAAFKLQKGQVSDPIDTAKGYYIIQVTSDPQVTSFEDAKRVLGFEMQSTIKTKLIDDLKKSAKVEYAVTPQKDAPKNEEPVPAPAPGTPPAATQPAPAPGTPPATPGAPAENH